MTNTNNPTPITAATEKHCKYCSDTFIPQTPKQIFCDAECYEYERYPHTAIRYSNRGE